MDTIQIMEQRSAGLRDRLAALRNEERALQRASGLEEQRRKDKAESLELETRLTAAKDRLRELAQKKAEAMQATATAIAEKMGRMLPYGRAVFSVTDEGAALLGWEIPNHGLVAHAGLSGGQKVLFDAALSYALTQQDRENAVILIEGAELGQEIGLLLNSVADANMEAQILACTCHEITAAPDGWKLERITDCCHQGVREGGAE
ncbi:hypothetical protein [uncultured Desulfovibrio sp.]|uniref:hypothetical protein n=1 Tax=uncultured Desulfovibrio sp. TaxID=167968 RepID=UPI00260E03BB|nr:hypothetical protein [uncultured Desulfovibrio sp.]